MGHPPVAVSGRATADLALTVSPTPRGRSASPRGGGRPRADPTEGGSLRVPLDLAARHATTASLRVSDDTPAGFDRAAASTKSLLAGQVQAALGKAADRELVSRLRAALDASHTIGVAVGILMVTHNLAREPALALLHTLSESTDRELTLSTLEMVHARCLTPSMTECPVDAEPEGRRRTVS